MVLRYFLACCAAFVLCLFKATVAYSGSVVDDLILQAEQMGLAQHPQWLALGHYKHLARLNKHNESYVDDVQFFLAERGAVNPEAELRATLQNIKLPAVLSEEQRNRHPRCRYPARYDWLSQQLNVNLAAYGQASCPLYEEWRSQIKAGRVTLVYAASYLNSPSSMYGHTLLRLDPVEQEDHSEWLSWAVNFGADIPPDEGSIMYAYRGIFGGYPGKFSVLAYLEKIKDYNKVENRDLWEYELNLTQEETRRLVTHLWELKDISFDYFFFDENCSYRLLELLEFARPGVELTDDFSAFAIPADTVRSIKAAGFVRSEKRRASKANIITHQLNRLSATELALTANLIENPQQALQSQAFADSSPQSQARSVKTAIDFLNYKFRKTSRKMANVEGRFALLQISSQLPSPRFMEIKTPTPPEDGHESSLVAFKAGSSDSHGYFDITLRASFHDLVDNILGYDKGAAINMGGVVLRYLPEQDELNIHAINLIDIHSFSPRNRFFKPISWEVELGAETQYHQNGDRLAPQVNASGGVSYAAWDGNISYALLGIRTEFNPSVFDDNFGLGGQASVGSLVYSPAGTTQLQWNKQFYTSGYERSTLELLHNIPLGKDNALRLSASRLVYSDIRFNEFGLEWRYFF